jgi:signal transduction histidine kinase
VDKEKVSELVTSFEKAAAFGEKEGKEKASAIFNDNNGPVVNNNSNIFALDYNGTVLSMPYQPERVGKNYLNVTYIYGTPVSGLQLMSQNPVGDLPIVHIIILKVERMN